MNYPNPSESGRNVAPTQQSYEAIDLNANDTGNEKKLNQKRYQNIFVLSISYS